MQADERAGAVGSKKNDAGGRNQWRLERPTGQKKGARDAKVRERGSHGRGARRTGAVREAPEGGGSGRD